MRNIMGVMLLVAACSGGDGRSVPTCQQAVSHFYAAGCKFRDLQTGMDVPEGEVTLQCRQLVEAAPGSCVDDVENYRICLNSVPTPSTTNADCDCSAEQEALLTCE